MTDAPIRIVPYDPRWPEKFERERALLATLLNPWIAGAIEHVGSTSVLGLAAKPVIDIMAGVETLRASEPAKAVLRENGYQYAEYKSDIMHWFCKPSAAYRTHHLHLIPFESTLWRERLAFRNVLRRDAVVRGEYEALKLELAKKYEFDREAYTEAKGPFVARVLEKHARPERA